MYGVINHANYVGLGLVALPLVSYLTITPEDNGFRKGLKVSYKLNEPWKGFVDNGDFVRGAGDGTLTRGLILGKDAL